MPSWIITLALAMLAALLGFLWKRTRDDLEEARASAAALRTSHAKQLEELRAEHAAAIKRRTRELDTVKSRAHLPLAQDMLEGLDVLDMAIDHADAHPETSTGELVAGVVSARASLYKALAKHDIIQVSPEVKEDAFDPKLHEAIGVVEDDALPAHTITSVMRPGWSHTTKVLRPAMVQTSTQSVGAEDHENTHEPVALDFSSPLDTDEQERDQDQEVASTVHGRRDGLP